MHRRLLLASPLLLTLASLTQLASAQSPDGTDEPPSDAPSTPRITVTTQQIQTAVAERFPLRYPVPGLLNLDLQTPRLQLLPEQNRINAAMDVQAAGAALQRMHQGTFEVDFALRYEPKDHTVRAYRLRLKRLEFPTLQPGVVALLNSYAPALAQQSMLEVVVHTLRPQDLALADGLGLQPGSITVTDSGLLIGLVRKPL